ncbi:hypothetical protein [Roseiconus lacunae]|uniref:hypothetical protein n=1 Tax=Roseiconus lacunae TaxID=2605694 RepID=UPI001E55EED6|nr:hypothetical protein [Roseiconus lacunae]MCD0459959.1 hypothetical protein [Roseiconus lacunae]
MKVSRNIPLVKAGDEPSASHQNRLIQQVVANASNTTSLPSAPNLGRVVLRCRNSSGQNYEVGEAVAWTGALSVTDASEFNPREALLDLVCGSERPVWHTNIANIGVVLDDMPDGDFGRLSIGGLTVIRLSTAADGEYAFIDPAEPKHWKLNSSSGYKVVDRINDDWAIVNLSSNEPFWRYKLTEASQAPGVTTATLYTLDGTQFSTTEIELSDPLSIGDNETADYQGYCRHTGNEFHIAEGPCSG